MAYGSVMASFNVEDFGTERARRARAEDEIAARLAEFKRLTHFEAHRLTRPPTGQSPDLEVRE